MNNRVICHAAWLLSILITAAGCPTGKEPLPGRLRVAVGVPPIAYLVERIGGERVAVEVLVKPGQDPHTYEPTPRQIQAIGEATLFFETGLPLEKQLLERIRTHRRPLTIVDVTEGIQRRILAGACCGAGHDQHEHHCNHHCDAGDQKPGVDPHVWLSPPLLKTQATHIAEALTRADSAGADEYRKNLQILLEEIDAVHEMIAAVLEPCRGQAFYVFHPAFGYFGDAYGLEQEAIEAGGKPPMPRQLRALIHKAKSENVQVIFVQPQFDHRSAEAVAQVLGGNVVPIDPLAKDVLANLQKIAVEIKRGIGIWQ